MTAAATLSGGPTEAPSGGRGDDELVALRSRPQGANGIDAAQDVTGCVRGVGFADVG